MRLVTIKRATTDGAIECIGELYEFEGFQFCITYDLDYDMYYAIEVSTGLCAHRIYSFEQETGRACINGLKRWIRNNIFLFSTGAFERSKTLLSVYKFNYPLNNKI